MYAFVITVFLLWGQIVEISICLGVGHGRDGGHFRPGWATTTTGVCSTRHRYSSLQVIVVLRLRPIGGSNALTRLEDRAKKKKKDGRSIVGCCCTVVEMFTMDKSV